MATVEQGLSDLEYVIGHLPEDLDARFAGVDTAAFHALHHRRAQD